MAVADRIRKWREAKGLSQQELADAVGVTRSAVNQWEKKTPKLRRCHVEALAKALGRPPSTFTEFGGDTLSPAPDGGYHSILILGWDELKHVSAGGVMLSALKKPQYVAVAKDISARAFMLVVRDDSMEPEFFQGDEIVIDPDTSPQDSKDHVLVRLKDGSEVFRRYVARRAGAFDLVAENSDWETHTVNTRNPGEILGTLVEHRKKRRTS